MAPSNDAPLDRATQDVEARHPGQSAFRLVVEGAEAFVGRVQSARLATRTLDVQTYIWHADLTGIYFAQQLIEAADRGVKVRVLLDDMDARAKSQGFAALAAHPHIDVRIFNPFASRGGTLAFIVEGIGSFGRINRRMHNKTWIADNRIAFAGGRNLGDEYFAASDKVNFVDLDFAMIGPVVREASASFDRYWNSPAAYSIESLDAQTVDAATLEKLRSWLTARTQEAETSRYAVALRENDAIKRMLTGDWPLEWSDRYRFVADDPAKITMQEKNAQRSEVGATLVQMVQAARSELAVISPYFVPGEGGARLLIDSVHAGKAVRVLTNSLAANDVAAVHGGYSRHRRELLEGGVDIWELKPLSATPADASLLGSSGASLHTKAFSADGRVLFVGSYNFDPRSTWLNCEQGIMVENATLTGQLNAILDKQTSGEHAWRVSIENDELQWSDGTDILDEEPNATFGRRFQAALARLLHLDAQL